MVLEAVMICVDNSDWSRNGDYPPNRLAAQVDCVNFIASQKINSNPESTVGLMSFGRDRIEVHISPTRSIGSIMTALAKDVVIGGKANFIGGIKTAALALKNRQNKSAKQRVIAFVASPLTSDAKDIVKLGKALKKNGVSLDLVNFGAENSTNDNVELLEALIAAVNSGETSHLVNVPPGPHVLADMVVTSPILNEGGAVVRPGGTGGADAFGGDVDANMDPEMAMAIRMSMEEERARQQKLAGESTSAAPPPSTAGGAVAMEEDEEALLQRAIEMSMQTEQDEAAASASTTAMDTSAAAPPSTTASTAASEVVPGVSSDDWNSVMQNPDFLNSLIQSVDAGATQSSTDDAANAMIDALTQDQTRATKPDDDDEEKKKKQKDADSNK